MRGFTLLSSAALIVYTGSPASAQTSPAVDAAAQADASGSQSDDTQSASSQSADIVVTGSRISNPNMTSPTPVTAVDSGQLLASQPTTIGAALNNLPQLVSVGGTQANGGTQSAGQFNLNLRGLGATRTLILLDGMRVPATSTLNTVDTNLLPQNLIQRVDIVTGGASAAYGSDAVSGVVNFVLDREFSGLKVEGSSGISGEGDNAEYRGALAFGTDFAGGRGHILLAGEYFSNKGVEGDARDFRREGDNIIVNPNAPPTLITARDVRIPFTFGGLITSATGGTAAAQAQLVGTQFFPNGQFGRFDFGTLTTASNQSGGDGINTATLQPIARPLDRRTAFGRVSYELAPDITAFAQGFYAYSKAQSYTAPYRIGGAGALLIQNDNAFLPDPVRQQMAALGVTSFRLGRYDSEYRTDIEDKNFTGVAMAGINAKFGDLSAGVSAQYGKTVRKTPVYNNPLLARGIEAADAVRSANGTIICRSTLANPGNGCVPFNPFGVGSPSAASIAYVTGTNDVRNEITTKGVEGHVSGPLFDNWAGPVSFAAGIEYREQDAAVTSNPDSIARNFLFANLSPWTGRYKVTEGFAELDVPLMRDSMFGHALDVNGAIRRTHYSTSGSVTTWKIGGVYEPIAGLRARITQSRDIRAPNLTELFSAPIQDTRAVNDPFRNNERVANLPVFASGNLALRPETANTFTAGLSFGGADFLRGVTLSVDFYRIKISDVIATPSAQQVLDQCQQGATELCGFITRNAAGRLTQISTPYFNFAELYARGVDMEIGYRVPTDAIIPGKLMLRGLASYLANLRTATPGADPVDRAGDLGQREQATPRWRGQATVNYDVSSLRTFLQMRYIGSGRFNTAPTAPSANIDRIPATVYFDGQIGVEVREDMEFYLNVQNLFDRSPRFVPLNSNVNVTTNANVYDQIGRMFRVGFRAKF